MAEALVKTETPTITEARIAQIADIITKAQIQRFTGFQKSTEEKGRIEVEEDATVTFIDKNKPEGQQEAIVPMAELAEAFDQITAGQYDHRNGVYTFKVKGEAKTIEGEKIWSLTSNVFAWKLRGHPRGAEYLLK